MIIAGVDEVGRGPLAGPVVAAAVILPSHYRLKGLADSKTLSASQRERLADEINSHAIVWRLGRAEVAEIDAINILQASLLAMRRAVLQLPNLTTHSLVRGAIEFVTTPHREEGSLGWTPHPRAAQVQWIFVDGNNSPDLPVRTKCIVRGDKTIASISAAAIMAKVSRDQEMTLMAQKYPGYGFAQHKGYPTANHKKALQQLGVCPIHRRSFRPVRELLQVGRP